MRVDKASSWEYILTVLHMSFTSHMVTLTCNYFPMNHIFELLHFNDVAYSKWCYPTVSHWALQAVLCCFVSVWCLPTTSSCWRWVRKSAFHLCLCSKWHQFKERVWKAFTMSKLCKLATRLPIFTGLWLWNMAVHCYLDNRISRAFMAIVAKRQQDKH